MYDLIGFIHRPKICGGSKAVFEFWCFFETVNQACVATLHKWRHGLGDAIPDSVFVAQNACRVAHSIARFNCCKSNDLCHVVATIFLGRVLDHFFAISRVKVHVDVRHALSTWVKKALEQQVILEWIEICDAQAICHGTTSSRPTTWANPDSLVVGIVNEIPNNQKVRLKVH